jgi:membrane protease YdiL (CAAX protease family)
MNREAKRPSVVLLAVAFEGLLGAAGAALAYWLDLPLTSRLSRPLDGLARGAAGLAPLLIMLTFATRSRWTPLADLRRQMERLVGELFAGVSWLRLAVVSLAAGAGEELLFRGALQPLAERWVGPLAGLTAVSVLFGVLHAATTMYFVLATAVGFYLGWLAQHYDDLVAPIFIHAAYDFAALVVLQRAASRGPLPSEAGSY